MALLNTKYFHWQYVHAEVLYSAEGDWWTSQQSLEELDVSTYWHKLWSGLNEWGNEACLAVKSTLTIHKTITATHINLYVLLKLVMCLHRNDLSLPLCACSLMMGGTSSDGQSELFYSCCRRGGWECWGESDCSSVHVVCTDWRAAVSGNCPGYIPLTHYCKNIDKSSFTADVKSITRWLMINVQRCVSYYSLPVK